MSPGPQAAKEAGKEQLSLRPLTTRPKCGGPARVRLLSYPSRDPRPKLAQGLTWKAWEEDKWCFLLSSKPQHILEKQTIGETWRNKRPFDRISEGYVARSLRERVWEGVRNRD